MREKIMTRYQPSFLALTIPTPAQLSVLLSCQVEVHQTSDCARLLIRRSPLFSVAVNAASDGFLKSSMLDR